MGLGMGVGCGRGGGGLRATTHVDLMPRMLRDQSRLVVVRNVRVEDGIDLIFNKSFAKCPSTSTAKFLLLHAVLVVIRVLNWSPKSIHGDFSLIVVVIIRSISLLVFHVYTLKQYMFHVCWLVKMV